LPAGDLRATMPAVPDGRRVKPAAQRDGAITFRRRPEVTRLSLPARLSGS
jgi:hypothetical protein